jgi:splicing factor 45
VWDPLEQYDPLRPNDYNEYKVWKQKERIERRERLAEQRRQEDKKRYRRSSSCSDSERSASGDEPPRKAGMWIEFALKLLNLTFPVAIGRYEEHYDRWSRDDDERPRGIGAQPPAVDDAPVPIDQNISGEEAFQRRLAMSMARKGVQIPAAPPPSVEPVTHHVDDSANDEVTTDRNDADIEDEPDFGTTNAPAPRRAPLPDQEVAFSSLAYNPFAPPPVPPPPPGPPAMPIPGAFEDKIKAAEAIAAKLRALAPPAGAPVPATPSQDMIVDEEAPAAKRSV